VHLTSPNREVHAFSAYPEKGLHIRSNSRVGFQRVLGLVTGKPDDGLTGLGRTKEFQYIRTLMPFDSPDEDGLIYLSDPFIRRLVGPEVKLTEMKRLKCFNHLRMMGHAAAMYEAEHGRPPTALAELRAADCLPNGFVEQQVATREASPAQQIANSKHNLKMIGLAMHNYHDVHGHFPASFSKDVAGNPLFSLRVHLLPYLNQAQLYNEFNLKEAWDSPHNKALIGRMPINFRGPGAKVLKSGMTTYQTVAGNKTMFPVDGSHTRLRDVTDGTSNTAMVIDRLLNLPPSGRSPVI